MSKHDDATNPALIAARGLVRRLAVSKAAALLWDLLGVRVGTSSTARERIKAEPFYGIGIMALPSNGGAPEAIVLNVAGALAPVIVAARDAKAQQAAVPSNMSAGEVCVYSDGAIVYVRANGTVEVRTPSGTAKRLLTVEDGAALKQAISTAATGTSDGGAAFKANLTANLNGWPTGTTVLKGE